MRLLISLTKEQYKEVKDKAGLIPMASYIRNKVFGESDDLGDWKKLLKEIPDRNELLKDFLEQAKLVGREPSSLLAQRLRR